MHPLQTITEKFQVATLALNSIDGKVEAVPAQDSEPAIRRSPDAHSFQHHGVIQPLNATFLACAMAIVSRKFGCSAHIGPREHSRTEYCENDDGREHGVLQLWVNTVSMGAADARCNGWGLSHRL